MVPRAFSEARKVAGSATYKVKQYEIVLPFKGQFVYSVMKTKSLFH